jgi:predicted Zn-dependent peptidase
MSLVVLGGQSLDTLQEWVSRLFGGIPRGTVGPPADFAAVGPPFEVRLMAWVCAAGTLPGTKGALGEQGG